MDNLSITIYCVGLALILFNILALSGVIVLPIVPWGVIITLFLHKLLLFVFGSAIIVLVFAMIMTIVLVLDNRGV